MTAAATAASSTMPAAVSSASATTAASAAFALRTGFIDDQSAAKKVLAVQSLDCFFRFRIVADLSETEAAGLSGKTIAQ
jgi:hypothetical protein